MLPCIYLVLLVQKLNTAKANKKNTLVLLSLIVSVVHLLLVLLFGLVIADVHLLVRQECCDHWHVDEILSGLDSDIEGINTALLKALSLSQVLVLLGFSNCALNTAAWLLVLL
ncbi:hypothetical protein Tco_1324700, partial [Tanacetum coccineum]